MKAYTCLAIPYELKQAAKLNGINLSKTLRDALEEKIRQAHEEKDYQTAPETIQVAIRLSLGKFPTTEEELFYLQDYIRNLHSEEKSWLYSNLSKSLGDCQIAQVFGGWHPDDLSEGGCA